MLKPSILKTIAKIALVCSCLGALICLLALFAVNHWKIYVTMVSWLLLCYSSFLGIKLVTYDIYEDDLKSLGYYLYGVLILFVLFICFDLYLGIIPACVIAFRLHVMKTNMDSWMKEQAAIAATQPAIDDSIN